MADTTTSPNMLLPVPVVGVDAGPDWATNYNSCLSAIDSHNHSTGQGVQITPSGININASFPMNGNDLTNANSVGFSTLGAASTSLTRTLQVVSADLYYIDGSGNSVRITQSGSVTGSSGTITGLPSGTASAAFSGGTFTFQSATNTPATLSVGPIVTGAAIASPKTVTIAPSASQAANYALTLPLALPVSTSFLNVDSSGNMSSVATTGSGNVVLATSPTITTPVFSGLSSGTIVGGTFTPTITWTYITGGTATITNGTISFYYTRVGNIVHVSGYVPLTITGYSGTEALYSLSATIPITTSTLIASGVATVALIGRNIVNYAATASGTTTVIATAGGIAAAIMDINANTTGTLTLNYSYQIV